MGPPKAAAGAVHWIDELKITSATFITSAASAAQFPALTRPEVAFAGRSNVGKSSLVNTLVNRRRLVKTSNTPGRTRLINFFEVNETLTLVDLPGYGYAKVPRDVREAWQRLVFQYLGARPQLKLVVVLLDSRHPPTGMDRDLIEWLLEAGHAVQLVMTKTDKLSRTQLAKQRAQTARELQVPAAELLAFSSRTGQGRQELWRAIHSVSGKGGA